MKSYSQLLESCKPTHDKNKQLNTQSSVTIKPNDDKLTEIKQVDVTSKRITEPVVINLKPCKQTYGQLLESCKPTNNKNEQNSETIDINLKYAHEWLRSPLYERCLYKQAIEQNRVDFIKWVHENNKCDFIEYACDLAILYGTLDIVKIVSKYAKQDYNFCTSGAKYGKLDVVKWAFDNCYGLTIWVSYYAAENGRFDILEWAHKNGGEWNYWVCYFAAKNNDLSMLIWARARRCEWNKSICTIAARNGHLLILKWAINNGCSYDKLACLQAATTSMETELNKNEVDYNEIIKWINEIVQPIQIINQVAELEPEKSKLFTTIEYDNFELINAVELRKIAIQSIIKSIKYFIDRKLAYGFHDHHLAISQIKYYDELKHVLEYFQYSNVKLVFNDEINTNVIHIEW